MIPIQQLLARFKNLKNTDKAKKELIVEVLLLNKIPASAKQISFSKKTILIKVPPIIKTEILLKKELLLEQIKKNLGEENFTEIQ